MGSESTVDCSTCGRTRADDECQLPCPDARRSCAASLRRAQRINTQVARADVERANDPYREFRDILKDAYRFTAVDKGHLRHGSGQPWTRQPWVDIVRHHGIGFCLGQVEKKAAEVHNLDTVDAKVNELLGVIGYAAQAIHAIRMGY